MDRIARVTILLVGLFGLSGISGPAAATTYYVSTSGSDSNPGTSSSPFRTITHGYGAAVAGDTVMVMPGTYTDHESGLGLHINKTGTASQPITLRSQGRGQAVIDGQNSTDWYSAIYLDGSYNIIDGFRITNGYNGGILVYGSNNQMINSEIDHNGNVANAQYGQDGIYSDQSTSGNTYAQNLIHENGRLGVSNLDHGLYLCGDNEVVQNNIVWGNAAYGLRVAGNSTVSNMQVYNNVFALNGRSGIVLWQDLAGIDIKNNIFYKNSQYAIHVYTATGTGVVIDHNISFGNPSGDLDFTCGPGGPFGCTLGTTIDQDPLFVSSADYHLRATSPGIDAGLTVAVPIDYAGTTRPQGAAYDIGAYEFVSQAQNPTADFAPSSLSFSSQVVGTTSAVQYATLTNNGNATLNLTNVVFSGDFAPAGLGTCGVGHPIPPGSSCTVSFQFTPTGTGTRTGSITVTDNAPKSPQVIPLPGVGAVAPPQNLMFNAGFESGNLSPWFNWGYGSISNVSRTDKYSGQVGPGQGGLGQTVTGITPGATYVMSVWAMLGSTSQPASVGVEVHDSSGTQLQNPEKSVNSTVWTQYTVTVTAPSNTADLTPWVWNNGGYVYVDDFSLTKQ